MAASAFSEDVARHLNNPLFRTDLFSLHASRRYSHIGGGVLGRIARVREQVCPAQQAIHNSIRGNMEDVTGPNPEAAIKTHDEEQHRKFLAHSAWQQKVRRERREYDQHWDDLMQQAGQPVVCDHLETGVIEFPPAEGRDSIVIDGGTYLRCANPRCHKLLRPVEL